MGLHITRSIQQQSSLRGAGLFEHWHLCAHKTRFLEQPVSGKHRITGTSMFLYGSLGYVRPPTVPVERIHFDEERLLERIQRNSQEAVVSCLSMHWINDLPGMFPSLSASSISGSSCRTLRPYTDGNLQVCLYRSGKLCSQMGCSSAPCWVGRRCMS